MQPLSLPKITFYVGDPSPKFRNIIRKYYVVSGWTAPNAPFQDKTLPNGCTRIVFHLRNKIQVSNVSYDGKSIPQHYIFGKYSKLIGVNHTFGEVDTFGVIFEPGAFRYICGAPQNEFTDNLFDVCDVLGEDFRPYIHRLEDSTSKNLLAGMKQVLTKRVMIFEEFLSRKLNPLPSFETNRIDGIITRVVNHPQTINLNKLAKEYKISEQHLNRLFKQEMGMSLVKYARIILFNQIVHSFEEKNKIDLFQLVVDYGFHDLPHFVKSFKKFTGDRPTKFLDNPNDLLHFLSF